MEKKKFSLQQVPHSIGIFRALQLGDLLCSLPAIRAIRKTYPFSKITLIGLPWAKEFINRFPFYIDNFVEFPGFPGIPEKAFDKDGFHKFIQNTSFDLLIQMHGNGRIINNVIKKIPAKYRLGFAEKQKETSNELYLKYPEHQHEILKWLKLIQAIKIVSRNVVINFPCTKQEEKESELIREKFQLKNFIIIHVGARDKKRRWKTEYFAMIADLLGHLGYQIVFTGTDSDASLVKDVQKKMMTESLDITGYTSLGTVASLLTYSKLLITNDTGISHIAAAVKAKSIVIFSEFSSLEQWAPLNTDLHIAIPYENALPSMVYNIASLILGHRNKLAYIPQKEILL
ncbi:MAG TPA: glycosyltransferase family 9 protein [Candidatus Saccharimonadales bacterium]|nr:glycosyltransferase family 9 protein [Candidatus Saccharimonadales bacterium]